MTDSQQIYHMVPARTSFHFSNRRTGIHIVLHTRLLRGTWERVERREKKKKSFVPGTFSAPAVVTMQP